MTTAKVPARITHEELETAFPWVRSLPTAAKEQLMAVIDNYREAARIYSRKKRKLPS